MTLGMFTSMVQKLVIKKVKDNAEIDLVNFGFELCFTIFGVMFIMKVGQSFENSLIVDTCSRVIHISEYDRDLASHGYFYLRDFGHFYSY